MYGSLGGNLIGIVYVLLYQILGIYFAGLFVKKERRVFQVLIGSITGSVALHWFPSLTSMVMQFTVASHVVALILFAIVIMGICLLPAVKKRVFEVGEQRVGFAQGIKELGEDIKGNPVIVVLMAITFVLFAMLLQSHTLPGGANGEMRTGQCTYSDMNLHLGFITSIANQHTFPPNYNILPDAKLAYPFLCDSVSSSVYVFGASLRFAYMFPMWIAFMQAMLGFYCLAKVVLRSKAKSVFAWVLFFFNGGFGFVYFLDAIVKDPENFTRIFSAYYETPTNLIGNNIRWVNVIVDMMLPQRSTLFGWAVLFGTLALLYLAMEQKNKRYFVLVGLFGGALPLIHTHSFLSLAMISLVWVTGYMFEFAGGNMEGENKWGRWIVPISLVVLSILQILPGFQNGIEKKGIVLVLLWVAAAVVFVVYYLYRLIVQGKLKEIFSTWGIYLILVLVLALPQLFKWTFVQTSNGGFTKGHFNWANDEGDQYLWFYLKNIGMMALVSVPAFVYATKRKFLMAAPALFILPVVDLVVFQRNVYDNNKLLYVAYALTVILCADFLGDIFAHIRSYKKIGSYVAAAVVVVLCTASAVLSMGREYASGAEYELYGADQVALCEWIEENTEADAVFATNERHNNAISSLTGRNLACGSPTFLYSHGIDYTDREAAVAQIYTAPANSMEQIEKYDVDYILVGPDERGTFPVDEAGIQSIATLVFSQNDVQLYQVNR